MSNPMFSKMDLHPGVLRALDEAGITTPTAIQSETVPLIRSGVDVFGRSQTGTGKTIAFGIPAIECIEETNGVQVLILSPTRELCCQCGDEIRKLSKYLPHIKTVDIYGGVDYKAQFRDLKGANMVIGTPGRVMDHMRKGTLKLNKLKMIILDEADEMLNMGFKEDIETILEDVNEDRQVILFSATAPRAILDITKNFQKDPANVEIDREKKTVLAIKQTYVDVPKHQKLDALKLLIHYYRPHKAIIFVNTKSMADEMGQALSAAGFAAKALHGDMKQAQRSDIMQGFRAGMVKMLVATDVAARGIDVSDIDYVINYDIPKNTEYYIHRIGRTGRAGREGTAVTICTGRSHVIQMEQLGRRINAPVIAIDLPSISAIEKSNLEHAMSTVIQAMGNEPKECHQTMLDDLMDMGYSAKSIALALMGMHFKQNTDELVAVKSFRKIARKEPTREFGRESSRGEGRKERDSYRERDSFKDRRSSTGKQLSINIGAADGVRENHVVGSIVQQTGVNAKSIERVEIGTLRTTITVHAEWVDAIITGMNGRRINGKKVHVSTYRPNPNRGAKKPFKRNKFSK